jgi:hypothetical protein
MEFHVVEVRGLGFRKKIPCLFKNSALIFHTIYIVSFLSFFCVFSIFGPESIWLTNVPFTIHSIMAVCLSSILAWLFLGLSINLALASSRARNVYRKLDILPDATSTIYVNFFLSSAVAMILTAFLLDKIGN